jgi:hypothetical protein
MRAGHVFHTRWVLLETGTATHVSHPESIGTGLTTKGHSK